MYICALSVDTVNSFAFLLPVAVAEVVVAVAGSSSILATAGRAVVGIVKGALTVVTDNNRKASDKMQRERRMRGAALRIPRAGVVGKVILICRI